MAGRISNCVGFDDAPFEHSHRGDVRIVGTVCAGTRLDGVLSSKVRRDGANATRRIIDILERSQHRQHIRAVLLQGIAVAGFNVVDIHTLAKQLQLPVLVVARRQPRFDAIKVALQRTGPGWQRKWRLIERAGEMEPLRGLFVQRAAISIESARQLLASTTMHGKLPEPLRLAHLIAGGVTTGVSRGRA